MAEADMQDEAKRKDRAGGKGSGEAGLAETVRQQQHTGSHDKPGEEAHGSDRRGGTRAGAENVEPRRKP
jgi:hypothetical protein